MLFRTPIIIWYAVVLHVCWAVLLLFSPDPLMATPVHSMHQIAPRYGLIGILLLASMGAIWGIRHPPSLIGFLLVMPQQILLLIMMGGASLAVLTSQYADGVPRPPLFILADQLPALLTTVFHTISVILIFGSKQWTLMSRFP